jgi:predicted Zn-dependent protease
LEENYKVLVNILTQPEIAQADAMIVFRTIVELTNFLSPNLDSEIGVQNLAAWKAFDYQEGTSLVPHKSVNWLIESAYRNRVTDNSLNSATLLADGMTYSLKQGKGCPLVVLLVDFDIVHPKVGLSYGISTKFWCSVISLYRFKNMGPMTRSRVIRALTLHEGGHLFGLVGNGREQLSEEKLGRHCVVHPCVMRQGMSLEDWSRIAAEMRDDRPFCIHCQRELLNNAKQLSKSRSP